MKKKILIRIGSLRHGGAEKVLVEFLKNLPENKYEIDLLLNLHSGKYLCEVPQWINVLHLNKGEMITTNRLQDIPIKLYRNLYQGLLKKFPFLLYKFILKNKIYDIEFAAIHGFYDEILNSPQKKSKKLLWVHNDVFSIKEYTTKKIKRFFEYDKIMVISDKMKQEMLNLAENQTQKEKIIRIYNPVNTQEILDKSLENVDFSFENNFPTFVSVGTVFPQKGFDRLLRVHQKLINENLFHNVLIVGNGYDFDIIKALLSELQIEKTAKMYGFTANPYPFFKIADFFILSSRYEGFPTVLTEAIVLQKPIVATDVSGVKDLLENGKFGLIVENSEEGIYQGMKLFLTDKGLVNHYQKAINQVKLPFELHTSVTKIETILDSL